MSKNSSTGPRTPEGKAISARNRLSHGLTGKFYVLFGESQAEFDEAHADLVREHKPGSPTEADLVRRIAESAWLTRRAQRMLDMAFLESDNHRINLCLRYQAALDRAFYKALKELHQLQNEYHAMEEFASESKDFVPQTEKPASQNDDDDAPEPREFVSPTDDSASETREFVSQTPDQISGSDAVEDENNLGDASEPDSTDGPEL